MHHLINPSDYAASVVAVPPIALKADDRVNVEANAALIHHIEAGGVRILLYGGNANLYHFGLEAYRETMEALGAATPATMQVITSIGPDFGKAMAQVPIVRDLGFRNVMLLPTAFPSDSHGVATGVRRIAEAFGDGIILYLKREHYVDPDELGRLVADRSVRFIKYAVERPDASNDAYLDAVLAAVGAEHVASGMGETPIHDHLATRGLTSYTSGAVCIAPAAAMELLALYKAGRNAEAYELSAPFLAFEMVRAELGGIQVLHEGVRLARIADTGPLMPMVSNLPAAKLAPVQDAVDALLAAERATLTRSGAGQREGGAFVDNLEGSLIH